jgi:hypothetical protein
MSSSKKWISLAIATVLLGLTTACELPDQEEEFEPDDRLGEISLIK